MLCDVASIFVVRTLIVSQALYDGADTDRQYPNTHIHVYHADISRVHLPTFYRNVPPFMILIYIHVTGEI